MTLKKNDIITLEITDLTNEGNGVGRADDTAVFVPFTAVGDVISCKIVKVKSRYCYGIIEQVLTPSPERCNSKCEVYGKCGGCSFCHMSYEAEARAKEKFVKDAFERIGKLSPEFLPIIKADRTCGYRNKAQFPIAADENGKLFAGFYAKRSHRVIPIPENGCILTPEIFKEICDLILDFANEKNLTAYDEQTGRGLIRHIFLRRGEHSGEIMAAVVVTNLKEARIFEQLAEQLMQKFPEIRSFMLNENAQKTNVILGEKTLILRGSDKIYDIMCGNRISISLHSFYQVNTLQAERLYAQAAEFADLSEGDILLDLYCGAGTIGLSQARNVGKLIGVEIVAPAIENAKENAKLNEIDNAEFICADAGKAAKILFDRGESPDVIIADPARKGCNDEAIKYMAKMAPKKIVMISCNPATAARDCAALEGLGYKAQKCVPVDLFSRTFHVECAVLMSRVEK